MIKRRFNLNVKNFFVLSITTSFIMAIYFMFVGIYLKEKGYGETFVGNIYSIQTMSTALGSIISAYLLEKIGRKKSFLFGLLCIFLGTSTIVVVESKIIINLMAILCGFGFSVQLTGEALFLTENAKVENRVLVLSLNFALKNIGMVFGNLLGGISSTMLKNYFETIMSLQIVIVSSAALALLSMFFVFTMKEEENFISRNIIDCIKSYKNILNKRVLLFMIYNSTIGFGAGMVVPFFSIYLKYSMSITDSLVGSILSFAQFGCVIGGFIIPFISKKIGRAKSIVLCQVLSIPFLLSIAFPQGLILIYISFFMRSTLMNMAQPLIQNLSMELVNKTDRANLSSFFSLSSNFMRALGILSGGYIMEIYSYNMPYYFTVCFYIVGTIIFTYLYKEKILLKKAS